MTELKFKSAVGRFLINSVLIISISFLFLSRLPATENQTGPFQTTGIKIGEVSDTEAIVWTRLTRNSQRVGADAPMPEVKYIDPKTKKLEKKRKGRPDMVPAVKFPQGVSIETIEGAVPGATGELNLFYKPAQATDWKMTGWEKVAPKRDFTFQFKLTNLKPDSRYLLKVESRVSAGGIKGQTVTGNFKTAPRADQPAQVIFAVSTGQGYNDHDLPGQGYKIYNEILKLDPSFFVHTGDILYYDRLAKTAALARWHWARMYSFPTNVEFHRQVASYFIKDDHDTWMNDCWPGWDKKFMGEFTFEQGLAIFREQVPMGKSTYRTFRWGQDLQIWLVEGRDFRSPNTMPDGPEKTIWGKAQKKWFKQTVTASDATFRVLISPTPIVGPDRKNKKDNHSNKNFKHEGDEIRQFLAKQKNMFVICGDRHWQYVSVDLKTGVREYSCGPASDVHAGGWKNENIRPEHKYLNVIGGFLAVTVDREAGVPTAIFRHCGVNGQVYNEEKMVAE